MLTLNVVGYCISPISTSVLSLVCCLIVFPSSEIHLSIYTLLFNFIIAKSYDLFISSLCCSESERTWLEQEWSFLRVESQIIKVALCLCWLYTYFTFFKFLYVEKQYFWFNKAHKDDSLEQSLSQVFLFPSPTFQNDPLFLWYFKQNEWINKNADWKGFILTLHKNAK